MPFLLRESAPSPTVAQLTSSLGSISEIYQTKRVKRSPSHKVSKSNIQKSTSKCCQLECDETVNVDITLRNVSEKLKMDIEFNLDHEMPYLRFFKRTAYKNKTSRTQKLSRNARIGNTHGL